LYSEKINIRVNLEMKQIYLKMPINKQLKFQNLVIQIQIQVDQQNNNVQHQNKKKRRIFAVWEQKNLEEVNIKCYILQ
jgi:hypothetical protein